MSTLSANDSKTALGIQLPPSTVKSYATGTFKVEKVSSLDDFKAKIMGMRSLKPAVLVG
jgi:hypothetical protein